LEKLFLSGYSEHGYSNIFLKKTRSTLVLVDKLCNVFRETT